MCPKRLGNFFLLVKENCKISMSFKHGRALSIRGYNDHIDRVGHEAIAPNYRLGLLRRFTQ
jgi:hypothetical protein